MLEDKPYYVFSLTYSHQEKQDYIKNRYQQAVFLTAWFIMTWHNYSHKTIHSVLV